MTITITDYSNITGNPSDINYSGVIGNPIPDHAALVGAIDDTGNLQALKVDNNGALVTNTVIAGDVVVETSYAGTIGEDIPATAALMGAEDVSGKLQTLKVDVNGALKTNAVITGEAVNPANIFRYRYLAGSYPSQVINTYEAFVKSRFDIYNFASGSQASVFIPAPSSTYTLPNGTPATTPRANIIIGYDISVDDYCQVLFSYLNPPSSWYDYLSASLEPNSTAGTSWEQAGTLTVPSSFFENTALYIRCISPNGCNVSVTSKYIEAPTSIFLS